MFKRVLVPLDGSERAERVLPLASRLASAPGGSLVLLYVVPEAAFASISFDIVDPRADLRREAQAYLKTVAGRPELASVTIQTRVIVGFPAVEILNTARGDGVDVIAMCSHGRTGFAKWAMGSVAQKVAQHSTVPVLVLKEGVGTPLALKAARGPGLRVLIPLDGSSLAEAAIAPALDLLACVGAGASAAVHLLRVIDLTTFYGHVGDRADLDPTVQAARTTRAQTYLAAMADQVRRQLVETLPNARITWSVATSNDPAAIITATASGRGTRSSNEEEMPYDVVAMATHGRGGVGPWAAGSVTERVLTSASSPILVVPSRHKQEGAKVPAEVHETPAFPPLL